MPHPYRPRPSALFGSIHRPLLDVEIRSEISGEWTIVEDVLADTGADASLLPLGLGKLIVRNVVSGKRHMVSGVVPGAGQAVYFHRLEFRIGRRTFAAPTLIADSDDCPAILGRAGALDRWTATFSRGRSLRIRK